VPDSATRADRVLRVGAVVTAVGLLFTVIAILPLVFPALSLPSAMWFLAMLTGIGLLVICAGLVMSARSRRSITR
jgi:hypothetical protein